MSDSLDIFTITHVNYVVMKQHTCMPVAKMQGMQACVFVTSHQHPTNRNAGDSSVGSVCMSVILVSDQQPSHYCHRASRQLYHYTCLIMWNRISIHVRNQDYRPAVMYVKASQDYQACYSTHFLKHCIETVGMFVTVSPDHLAYRIQAYISVKVASTFVVVELSQQVYPLYLHQTRSHVSYDCTQPMGLVSTIAPNHQAGMLQ